MQATICVSCAAECGREAEVTIVAAVFVCAIAAIQTFGAHSSCCVAVARVESAASHREKSEHPATHASLRSNRNRNTSCAHNPAVDCCRDHRMPSRRGALGQMLKLPFASA